MRKITALLLIFAISFMTGCAVIEDGKTGVKNDLGNISDQPVSTGIHFFIPGITSIEQWNTKTQELKEQARVPSSEGLISELDVSLLYRVPVDKAVHIRKTIGYDYRSIVMIPYFRDAIRNVASGYNVKALYSDKGRTEISQKIFEILKIKLEPKGIVVEDVLMRDVKLPPAFSESIERKLKTEQEALQKEFELTKAKKDAEIEVAKARGVAEANKIIASSITENYLRYKFIEGLNDGNTEVIYVPTEAGLPILEARNK